MARYERKDHYYRQAKVTGRASRASFKIEEIQERFRIIHPGDRVVDLGCAPGGWLQQLATLVGPTGRVVGIDQVSIRIPLPANAHFIQTDIAAIHAVPAQVTSLLGGRADVVVSDMAPHTTGVKFQDSYRSYELANMAWASCQNILRPGGAFVVKIFDGPEVAGFRKTLQQQFAKVHTFTTQASRAGSKELYLIGIGWIAQNGPDARQVEATD